MNGKKMDRPLTPAPAAPEMDPEEDIKPFNEISLEEVGEIPPLPKCDCDRKSPCPKPPCPCHLYDPCPKLPDCRCIYCNPLPKTPKPPPPEVSLEDILEKKGKDANVKGKDGKKIKDEKPGKGVKPDPKAGKDTKTKDSKVPQAKDTKGNGKDGKGFTEIQEEPEPPKLPYKWGAVEMYLFCGKEEGWEFWGRSERICDTPYPLPNESAKPKFLHVDDRLKVEDIQVESVVGESENKVEIDKDGAFKKPSEKPPSKVPK
jgi:hypothetical protein